MLKLKEITKDYKVAQGYVHALKGITLAFRKNEFVSVLGPSGCGKTTLLNSIGGLDHYTSGDLVIQGKSTKDFKDRDWDVYRNHRIGFIFQSYNLIPHQTVLSNVELALTIAGVGKEERRQRATKALERVGLGEELNKRPNQLSGGQMQRVAIARALVNNPDILLADEPTGALDSKTSVEVMELIKEISSERLVIMVTHNPELAEKYSSRIVRLKDGQVESDSAPYSDEEEERENGEELARAAEEAEEEEKAEKSGKKGKKPRAKMSFLTSLALSAKNLLTKKGRTIITSVAGSIGIISVCLVLALSSGFNNYIRRTEEDMLSYYPVEITENTINLDAVMSNAGSMDNLPDMEKLSDKVYVNSFLTQLAKDIAVVNNISPEYLSYLQQGKEEHPDWFSEIKYSYGVTLTNNLFTSVQTGGVLDREHNVTTAEEERFFSLYQLRDFYTNELLSLASEYAGLLGYVDFFTNVLGVMPGTDENVTNYGEYVLSQYDILAADREFEGLKDGKHNGKPHFPENENEAVLVIGENNDSTDLTLAQLGFLPEKNFMDLFDMGEAGNDKEGGYQTIPYEDIFSKQYVLYYNDAVYEQRSTDKVTEQPFSYIDDGERDDLATEENGKQLGIPVKITAILRLKEGRTYGCLTDGINLTEATVRHYIAANKESAIVKWAQSEEAKLPAALVGLMGAQNMDGYRMPSANLSSQYTSVDLGAIKTALSSIFGEMVLTGMDRMGGLLPNYPLSGDAIDHAAARTFFETFKSMIGSSNFGTEEVNAAIDKINESSRLIIPHIDEAPIGTDSVDGMIEQIDKLGTTFTHAELAKAVGFPIVTKYVEPKLDGIALEGTVSVSFAAEGEVPDIVIRSLGGNDSPNGIYIYPADFDAKENVLSYLDAWNTMEGRKEVDKITYTDRVGLLMGMMQTMLDVITYVLVAFTSISLVVSSVMIGIITYVSVVERVKEIGVLRSLGARKMDIRNLFNAETFIIGLAAGLIGVGVTYIISAIIDLIIFSLSGIAGIASLPPLTAFIMVCVSVALTLISGLIPAQAAAKKDPVIALRTE